MAQRLDRVERESRRLRWLILGAFTLGAIALGLSQGVFDRTRTISAGTLLVRNSNGDVVASMGSNADGRPYLGFKDSKGSVVATISVGTDDRPSISFSDSNKRLVTALGLGADTAICVHESKRRPAVEGGPMSVSGHRVNDELFRPVPLPLLSCNTRFK
jgi:hypothetical protein